MKQSDGEISITSVRKRIKGLLEGEVAAATTRSLVYLAIDGIPYQLAADTWKSCDEIISLSSVFPTTSSTCWTSAFTGLSVSEHGVVGTVFKIPESGEIINIYRYCKSSYINTAGNIFFDAKALGYHAIALESDLTEIDCGWKNDILRGADVVPSGCLFSSAPHTDIKLHEIVSKVSDCVNCILHAQTEPCLIWVFLDVDCWIHKYGYSDLVFSFLALIDTLSSELAKKGIMTVAHADHGLVKTIHDVDIAKLFEEVEKRFSAIMGGAGRVRWFYTDEPEEEVIEFISLKACGKLVVQSNLEFSQLHGLTGEALSRVGKAVVMPTGAEFISEQAYIYEHGSMTDTEVLIPFAIWRGEL